MFVYEILMGKYMDQIAHSEHMTPNQNPSYSKVACYTSAIFVFYLTFLFVCTYTVFYVYFPGTVQVFSPFEDTKVLKYIDYWDAIGGVGLALAFTFIMYIMNVLLFGSGAYCNNQLESNTRFSFASVVVKGNKYSALATVFSTMLFMA